MEARVCRIYSKKDIRVEEEPLNSPAEGEVLVSMSSGGICGSDIHYYFDGGFGKVRLKTPMILGHEICGTVVDAGVNVKRVKSGDLVSINPSTPCGKCKQCMNRQKNHCTDMQFLGSAMRNPHIQGGFRSHMLIPENQCHVFTGNNSSGEAALTEPLAVCLHAKNIAGELKDKRVLITGAGPIGCICVAVAKFAGAAHVAVTDIQDYSLSIAKKMGADECHNVIVDTESLENNCQNEGLFDVAFECSAVSSALQTAVQSLAPMGRIVQIGLTDGLTFPATVLVSKELTITGTFRFNDEFETAVDILNQGDIDINQIISHRYNIDEAVNAFEMAGDKSKSTKVMLNLQTT